MSFVLKKRMTVGDVINCTLLTLFSLVCIFPFLYIVSISFTDASVYVPLEFNLIPKKWSLDAYKYILSTDSFIRAFQNTVFITVVGTILNLLFTFTMAYGLTKTALPGRNLILYMVVFTFVFSAGLVPNYILVQSLGLLNSPWALIWPNLTNAWSLIVVKSFMDSLPKELEEAAKIDGSNDIGVFIRIIIPLSKPCIAAFTLFFAVMHWNQYFQALIYLTDHTQWTLQVLVAALVINSGTDAVAGESANVEGNLPSEMVRMASIVVAMVPILIVYPFLQKYFAKGVMLGSVKG